MFPVLSVTHVSGCTHPTELTVVAQRSLPCAVRPVKMPCYRSLDRTRTSFHRNSPGGLLGSKDTRHPTAERLAKPCKDGNPAQPCHSGILEPQFLSERFDLDLQMLILSHKSLACLRAVGHASDDRDETVSAPRDGLQNSRLDFLRRLMDRSLPLLPRSTLIARRSSVERSALCE